MTWLMVGTSMPRAATSVATSTRSCAAQACSTRLRRPCGMPPCSDATAWPISARRSASQSASRCVLVKTSAWSTLRSVRMWSSSAFLCVRSSAQCRRCSMSAWVSVCDATSMRCGSRSSSAARRPTGRRRWRCTSPSGASGAAPGDVVDVVDEAHVEHAVGFVQHQHLDVGQHGLAATPCGPSGGRAWRSACPAGRAAPSAARRRARRRRRWPRAGPARGGRRLTAALATCIASSRVGTSTSTRGPCTMPFSRRLASPRAASTRCSAGSTKLRSCRCRCWPRPSGPAFQRRRDGLLCTSVGVV
jgi:hypothetical protein